MISSKSLDQWVVAARKYVLAAGMLLVACATPLYAQEDEQLTSPRLEAKAIVGGAIFAEDLKHTLVGGAVRVYVTKRISIEPEYLYLRRTKHDQDHLGQINVAYDFTDPTKRVVLYGIGGAGVLHNRGRVFGSDFVTRVPFVREISFNTWTVSAGAGVKIFLTKRLFVSPEARLGREPTARATINVGYVFGGRR
jgi:hypothetical protein